MTLIKKNLLLPRGKKTTLPNVGKIMAASKSTLKKDFYIHMLQVILK